MVCFYATAILFVVIVLGAIAAFNGFSIFRFLNYIKEDVCSLTLLPKAMLRVPPVTLPLHPTQWYRRQLRPPRKYR